MPDVHEILESSVFDIIGINETKLDYSTTDSFYSNSLYSVRRRDRTDSGSCRGGGLLVFVKKHIQIIATKIHTDFEAIVLQLKIAKVVFNYICAYKSPSSDNNVFINLLENVLFELDPNIPIVIIGDLNINLLQDVNGSKPENELTDFLEHNQLLNFVKKPTRSKIFFF